MADRSSSHRSRSPDPKKRRHDRDVSPRDSRDTSGPAQGRSSSAHHQRAQTRDESTPLPVPASQSSVSRVDLQLSPVSPPKTDNRTITVVTTPMSATPPPVTVPVEPAVTTVPVDASATVNQLDRTLPTVQDDPVVQDVPPPQLNPVAVTLSSSVVSGVSSPLFPSLPTSFNQASMVDLMAMFTLFQKRMDQGTALPSAQDVPAVSTTPAVGRLPSPVRSVSPVRSPVPIARTPAQVRWSPDRRSRSPVRSARGADSSNEFSRSRSPLHRSSSHGSPARATSPVDFSAVLEPEEKKDVPISDDDDDEESTKKVSAAQYQIFRQAVTSSKGSYKSVPAKVQHASRASLLDLGEKETSERVSWLDQPSLQDTMKSTARITQGLKEEEVARTTLSESLNTTSSTFKHLTVKQVFPRDSYRLKIYQDAEYQTKPPGDQGFSDARTPSSYIISQRMLLDTEELAWRSAIYTSLADSMVASVIQELSPRDERTKLLKEKLTILQEAQVSAVSAGFAAASNLQLLRRDSLLKNFGFQPQVLSVVRTAPFEGSMSWDLSLRYCRILSELLSKRIGWLDHLQQFFKLYPSPLERQKLPCSRMRPVRAGEPS